MSQPRPDVISTYRMLRLALAAMAFAILVSAAVQSASQGCVLTSISGYWYTPADTVFVSCLVTIGVCLVALRGGTWTENLLLNLAGMFAPIVAIVPTQVTRALDLTCLGTSHPARSAVEAPIDAIDNGLTVYFVVAVLGFAVAVISSTRRAREAGATGPLPRIKRVARIAGLGLAALVLVALGGWRLVGEDAFDHYAHATTAIAMFTCIGLVVAFRTKPLAGLSRSWDGYRDDSVDLAMARDTSSFFSRAYALISGFMLASVLAAFFVFGAWSYRVITVEGLVLVSFIAFWLLQTWQLGRLESTS